MTIDQNSTVTNHALSNEELELKLRTEKMQPSSILSTKSANADVCRSDWGSTTASNFGNFEAELYENVMFFILRHLHAY